MTQLPAEPRRILFLFSDTGGGHRSAAEAIIEALNLEFPGQVSCEMVDILKEYAPPPFHLAPEVYPPLSRMPEVWKVGYRISDGTRRARAFYNVVWPYIRRNLRALLDDHPCDLVVSVHQVINMPVARLASTRGLPFITVVTDMVTTHAAWYATRATHVVVPTGEAFIRGLRAGMRPEQMTVLGMPVAERFNQPLEHKEAIREQLGWPNDRPVILMVGGGEGMGPMEKMAVAIDEANLPVSLAIIAGRNKNLYQRLERRKWNVPVKVYGFVKEMPAYMRAADVLVTKAGPGTISEGFIAGLPIILYSKMPGQEDGNVTFVVNSGAGVWAPEPEEVVDTLRRWVRNPLERTHAANISHGLARPRASRDIARLLYEHACGKS